MTDHNYIKELQKFKEAFEKHFNIKFIGHPNYWWFTDIETQSTLVVVSLSDIEDKLIESRKKFKQEKI